LPKPRRLMTSEILLSLIFSWLMFKEENNVSRLSTTSCHLTVMCLWDTVQGHSIMGF